MRGLSKRVRKKIYNDDYESKDVMDILEYIYYGVASLTLLPIIQDNGYRNAIIWSLLNREIIYSVMILKSVQGWVPLGHSISYYKSVNLQYITLGCLDDGTNESSTKSLIFQVLFFLYFL